MRLKAKRPTEEEDQSIFNRAHRPPVTTQLQTEDDPPPVTPPPCQVGRRNSAPSVPLSPEIFTPDVYDNDQAAKPICPRLKSCVKAHGILESKSSAPIPEPITPARAWKQHLESVILRGPIRRPDTSVLITADDMSSDDSTQNSESEGGEVFEAVCPVSPKSAIKFRVNEQAVESPRRARSEGRSLRDRLRFRRKKTGFMFNPDANDEQKQDLVAAYQKGVEEFKKRDILKAKFGSWKRKASTAARSDQNV